MPKVKNPPTGGKKKKVKKAEKAKKKTVKTVKKTVKKVVKTEKLKKPLKPAKYLEAVGRRKTAVARVRLFTQGEKLFLVNNKPLEKYFPSFELQKTVNASLEKMKCLDKFRITVIVRGGGKSGQAEAIRHGIARALILFNSEFRKRLKKAGFLKRDPRMRERKKFGLKRARRAPQWKKR